MLYMIIETFHPGKVKQLYKRFEEKGRLMPEGVQYINSWINEDVTTCYQVMESDTEKKIYEWIQNWIDLSDFKVIPVITSPQAKEKVFAKRV
jgi:2-hydroxy-3-keto-5-methylthiopentenyl-1-phosphate phosphatase